MRPVKFNIKKHDLYITLALVATLISLVALVGFTGNNPSRLGHSGCEISNWHDPLQKIVVKNLSQGQSFEVPHDVLALSEIPTLNESDIFVVMYCNQTVDNGTYGDYNVNNIGYGMTAGDFTDNYGAAWYNLTTTSIVVHRGETDFLCGEVILYLWAVDYYR